MRTRILIVDDDRVTLEMMQLVLEGEGYEVSLATDGKTGVEKAVAERPDLVLTDGLLPRMHGFLVCKAIKDADASPKVIIVTGVYTKPTYRSQLKRDYGADDLLIKPVSVKELLGCVRKHLAEIFQKRSLAAFAGPALRDMPAIPEVIKDPEVEDIPAALRMPA